MRVEVNTVESFVNELRAEAENIVAKIVRVRIDASPLQREAINHDFGLWATAQINAADREYILEFGLHCGQDDEGKRNAEDTKRYVEGFCDEYGLKLREGKIEFI